MSELSTVVKPVSLKCNICGGDLDRDYLSAICVCENCGNRWEMSDLIPEMAEHSHVTEKIKRAIGLLSDIDDTVNLDQALVLFKSAEDDCLKLPGEVATDLLRICNDGEAQIETLKHYLLGKNAFEKTNYLKAKTEFEKIKNFKDSNQYIEKCEKEIVVSRKKRIPFAVIIGMIIPAVVSVYLHETFGVHFGICIPIFIVISVALGFLIYRGGTVAIIVEIISFIVIVPLLLFSIMAYGFHMKNALAIKIAIGVPLVLIIIFIVLAERKK